METDGQTEDISTSIVCFADKNIFLKNYILFRFQNMTIPANMSAPQKAVIKEVLETVQNCLHRVNPFIRDFQMIMELPSQDLADGKIVISAKDHNNADHSRRYNLQANLQEVSIVTNHAPHDLVMHKRGGGLQTVSDLNPKAMPLHFTLMFPHGTYGWDPNSRNSTNNKRITAREYFAFHLNIRRGDNQDYLHMGCKLFQEWLCLAWVTVENQRLTYQSMNQKSLRAESYTNVREIVENRAAQGPGEGPQTIGRKKILASSFVGSPRLVQYQ